MLYDHCDTVVLKVGGSSSAVIESTVPKTKHTCMLSYSFLLLDILGLVLRVTSEVACMSADSMGPSVCC
jgi:hypothetical protein